VAASTKPPAKSGPRRRLGATERRALPRFTDRIALGKDLSVSPFCLGRVASWRLIPAAFEMGINFFFVTTDMHWPLYEASRKGLKALFARGGGTRDEIAVAGACYPTQPEFQRAPFAELVAAVPRLERVDVFVAGGAYGPDLLARTAALRTVAGNAGHGVVGASFHDRRAALDASNLRIVDLCYIRYNPVHPGAREDFLPQLRARRAPVFNFNSMIGFAPHEKLRALKVDPALWYPDPPDYYRYALSRPQMDGLMFAAGSTKHLVALDRALTQGGLTPAEEDHLDGLALLTAEADAGADAEATTARPHAIQDSSRRANRS
jgi:hypothetical protein